MHLKKHITLKNCICFRSKWVAAVFVAAKRASERLTEFVARYELCSHFFGCICFALATNETKNHRMDTEACPGHWLCHLKMSTPTGCREGPAKWIKARLPSDLGRTFVPCKLQAWGKQAAPCKTGWATEFLSPKDHKGWANATSCQPLFWIVRNYTYKSSPLFARRRPL